MGHSAQCFMYFILSLDTGPGIIIPILGMRKQAQGAQVQRQAGLGPEAGYCPPYSDTMMTV